MNAALRHSDPADQVGEAARVFRRPRGRPVGSDGPLAMWLKPQIRRFKAQGVGCTTVFRSLSVVEGGDTRAFVVSTETADAYFHELGVDIAGTEVTIVNFRKIWGRAD